MNSLLLHFDASSIISSFWSNGGDWSISDVSPSVVPEHTVSSCVDLLGGALDQV